MLDQKNHAKRLLISKTKEGKYKWTFCLRGTNVSCQSPSTYKDKSQCKRNAFRFVERFANTIKMIDSETGDIFKFSPNEVSIEDLLGDRRFKNATA